MAPLKKATPIPINSPVARAYQEFLFEPILGVYVPLSTRLSRFSAVKPLVFDPPCTALHCLKTTRTPLQLFPDPFPAHNIPPTLRFLLSTSIDTNLTHIIKCNTIFRPFTPPSQIYLQFQTNPAPAPILAKRLNYFSSRFFPLNLHCIGYSKNNNEAQTLLLSAQKFMLKLEMGCEKSPFLRLFWGAKLHNLINSLRVPQASADAGFGLVLQLRVWETRIHRVLWPELARKFDLWPPKIAV